MTTLDYARAYLRAGLSVLPIRADGSKAPALPSGHPYLYRRPDEADMRRWFAGTPYGVGIVGGEPSGGLEVLDFEARSTFEGWSELIEAECPGLLARLPRVATPGGGVHVYYRTTQCGRSRKLARDEGGETLIETRGSGGYVVAPGSPAACHPSGGLYLWECGGPVPLVPLLKEAQHG